MSPPRNSRNVASPRGFTLLELLVTIVIILILLGIGVEVGPAVLSRGGEEQVTKMALLNAQQLLEEFVAKTNADVSSTSYNTTAKLMTAIANVSALKSRLATLPPDVFYAVSGGYSMKDGWGNELYFNYNGTSSTVLPSSSGPYFASMGPDGAWGDVTKATTTAAYQQSQDNLYSFSVK